MKKELIVWVVMGLVIGIVVGFMLFSKTSSSNNEIIRTQADSFPMEKTEKIGDLMDISFDVKDCQDYKLNKTSTPEKIRDLICRIDSVQAVHYGDITGDMKVTAVCWCDFNVG
jgi:divalent metal cation (Fe/Co/Zn/Cd) transporter